MRNGSRARLSPCWGRPWEQQGWMVSVHPRSLPQLRGGCGADPGAAAAKSHKLKGEAFYELLT